MPVWWVDAPGEFFCSLMFRVGLADETLATNGITHLVEHLALFGLGRRDHPFNGFVDDQRCVFYASGERAEVLEFIRLVAASLGELPLDRLGVERRVLRAEASSAGGLYARLRGHRFGAAGFGLVNYRELGLRWLGRTRARAAARRDRPGQAPAIKLLGPLGIGYEGGMLWIDIGPKSRAREIGAEIERRSGEPSGAFHNVRRPCLRSSSTPSTRRLLISRRRSTASRRRSRGATAG